VSEPAATFLFADIAGFTALTEAHGDEEAATLVADFCDAVKGELPAGAAHVKTIGDALMLRIPDPCEAILLGLHITHGLMPAMERPRCASASITEAPSNVRATTSERRSTSQRVSQG
jgi:class 3 adenylate cyclase